ncbi:hypothetical protein PWY87_35775 [Kribbella solani]|uniref:Uncharacterized protein n=1 Tax=Streptomyces acidiscabies TaxID=42234 RepID=A0ABU4MF73_9ACTN|nr:MULTISPECIES: hypothetical protein [Actinomycetes]MDX2973816.1 hypothetical protein [Kribbella solani]MDX3007077.1 hypothetical protein [Kribbella solani]MDX3026142.1 hypothetical protein [Streptomyces acidiscabies]
MIRALAKRRRERRAAAALARLAAHFDAQLLAAADIAITRARRTLSARMPTLPLQDRLNDRERVDVDDVIGVAHEHFGLAAIPQERAAAALRARYEHRTGSMDLDTDAYDYPTNPTTDQEK